MEISHKNIYFLLFHSSCDKNRYQNNIVGVRADLDDYEIALKICVAVFQSNCRPARAPTPRARSIFLVIMEISHENVDFLFFHTLCDKNRYQNDIVGVRANLDDYEIDLKI